MLYICKLPLKIHYIYIVALLDCFASNLFGTCILCDVACSLAKYIYIVYIDDIERWENAVVVGDSDLEFKLLIFTE